MKYLPQIITSLVFLLIPLLATKWLVQKVAKSIGWHLKRRTSLRRNLISAQVEKEEEQYQVKQRRSPKSDDGDWEKVESYTAGTAKNGDHGDEEWQGFVGFFHPFWYIFKVARPLNTIS